MSKRMLSRLEVIKAHEFMKQHLIPAKREGYFEYQDSWSDAKIAQEIDTTIQASAIGNLRLELFGKLDTQLNITRDDNKQIDELKALYQNLLDCYNNLEQKHNMLIDTLALNRVVPTKITHLKTTHKED